MPNPDPSPFFSSLTVSKCVVTIVAALLGLIYLVETLAYSGQPEGRRAFKILLGNILVYCLVIGHI